MAISGRHCRSERAIVKRHAPPICHCEERSDVAISGRHLQFAQGVDKNAQTDCVCSGAHCAAVGGFAALRMRRTPCGCCAPRNDRKGFIDTLSLPPGEGFRRAVLAFPLPGGRWPRRGRMRVGIVGCGGHRTGGWGHPPLRRVTIDFVGAAVPSGPPVVHPSSSGRMRTSAPTALLAMTGQKTWLPLWGSCQRS